MKKKSWDLKKLKRVHFMRKLVLPYKEFKLQILFIQMSHGLTKKYTKKTVL